MIRRAEKIKIKSQIKNVEFIKEDAAKLNQIITGHFDFMTIVLCLHEMSPQTGRDIIADCLISSDTIIIADFPSLFPKGKAGSLEDFMKERGITPHTKVKWENDAGKAAIIRAADAKVRTRDIIQEP